MGLASLEEAPVTSYHNAILEVMMKAKEGHRFVVRHGMSMVSMKSVSLEEVPYHVTTLDRRLRWMQEKDTTRMSGVR